MRTRTVDVPEDLCRAAEERFRRSFTSLDELVAAVLRELLRDDALRLDEDEERIIEQRLRGLGYV